MRRVAERVAGGASDQELIDLVVAELTQLMVLVGCRFEVEATGPLLPVLERSGRIESPYRRVGPDGELALPPLGVRLPVVGGGRQVGSIVLDPDPAVGVTLEARVVAVALADQLGAAARPSRSRRRLTGMCRRDHSTRGLRRRLRGSGLRIRRCDHPVVCGMDVVPVVLLGNGLVRAAKDHLGLAEDGTRLSSSEVYSAILARFSSWRMPTAGMLRPTGGSCRTLD